MIPLDKQVVSLELSQALKEAGLKQEGLWWWVKYERTDKYELVSNEVANDKELQYTIENKFVAQTASELGEILPPGYATYKDSNVWVGENGRYEKIVEDKDTEVNARAKMVLWLVQEGLLKF